MNRLKSPGAALLAHLPEPSSNDLEVAMAASWKVHSGVQRVGVRRLTGGLNNDVYLCTASDVPVCVKWYRNDGRRRHERELDCLSALAGTAIRSPAPFSVGSHLGLHALAMEYVEPVRPGWVGVSDLDELGRTVRRQHECLPADVLVGLMESRVTREAMLAIVEGPDFFVDRACARAWDRVRPQVAAVVAGPATLVLGQSDGNHKNFYLADTGLAVVDFEYGGRSDDAYELALLREHPNGLLHDDRRWERFLAGYGCPPGSRLRAAADALAFLVLAYWTTQMPSLSARFVARAATAEER